MLFNTNNKLERGDNMIIEEEKHIRYSILKNGKTSYAISERYMHLNLWCFSVVMILIKVLGSLVFDNLCLLKASTPKLVLFHFVPFRKNTNTC